MKKNNISALKLSLYIISGIVLISLVITLFTTIYTKNNDKVDSNNSNENKEQLKDNTTNDNVCIVKVTNGTEFIEKVTKFNNDCNNYQVSYKDLRYTIEKKDNYYVNKIYYKDNEIKYMNTDSLVYSNLSQAYMLDSNTFLFLFHEIPVSQNMKYHAIAFNDAGEIKFSNSSAMNNVEFDKYANILSFKITKIELPTTVEEICNYINNYNQDDVIEERYTYKYNNNKMNLESLKTVTIADTNTVYCK